jgi:hypothetical protein
MGYFLFEVRIKCLNIIRTNFVLKGLEQLDVTITI